MISSVDRPKPETEDRVQTFRPQRAGDVEIKRRLYDLGFEEPVGLLLGQLRREVDRLKVQEMVSALQAGDAGGRVEIRSWMDLMSRPAVEWLVEDVLPQVGVGNLVGPPYRHKSNLLTDLEMSVACGLDEWMGFPIRRHGAVLNFSLEGVHGLAPRTIAWREGHSCTDVSPAFSFTESAIDLGSRSSLNAIKAAVRDMQDPPVLIGIDTQARATPGRDENSNTEMGVVMNNCKELAEEFGTFVLLVHHSGKSGPGARGASAQLAAVDASLQVDAEGRSFRVEKVKEAKGGQVVRFEPVEIAGSVYVRQVDAPADILQALLARERGIIEFVKANPGASKSTVAAGIGGRKQVILDEIDDLLEQGRLENRGPDVRSKLHVTSQEWS